MARAAGEASGRFATGSVATVMMRHDLDGIAEPAVAHGLTVHRVPTTPSGGGAVSLEQAVEACLLADPDDADDPPERIAQFLRSLPQGCVLAAVDSGGVVRATAASGVLGDEAVVVFVSTDAAFRRRRIGTAMTARALRAAAQAGAREAFLDATVSGRPIYARLGFVAVTDFIRYPRKG